MKAWEFTPDQLSDRLSTRGPLLSLRRSAHSNTPRHRIDPRDTEDMLCFQTQQFLSLSSNTSPWALEHSVRGGSDSTIGPWYRWWRWCNRYEALPPESMVWCSWCNWFDPLRRLSAFATTKASDCTYLWGCKWSPGHYRPNLPWQLWLQQSWFLIPLQLLWPGLENLKFVLVRVFIWSQWFLHRVRSDQSTTAEVFASRPAARFGERLWASTLHADRTSCNSSSCKPIKQENGNSHRLFQHLY